MNELVLLLTFRQDYYTVDLVADALRARGAEPVRVDTDRFPLEMDLTLILDRGACQASLRHEGRTLHAQDVRAVWLRHLGACDPGEAVDPAFRGICAMESQMVMHGFLQRLDHAKWINPLGVVKPAEEKLRQLRVAQEVGLRIPATLVTNHGDAVRPFFHRQATGMVMKLQAPLSTGMDGQGPFLYTQSLQASDLEHLGSLRLCPQLFQERIPKAAELRVIYVEGRCFAGSVRPPQVHSGTDDWRPLQGLIWEEDELPADCAARFHDLMSRLGLRFGAADFIRTPEGELVFLEVNPSGEWGMLERDLGLPISQALADALLAVPN